MHNIRRITPMCPKCRRHNTYDIVPEIPNHPDLQLQPSQLFYETYSVGNAKYFCIDCQYNWKKYRGKKPYERIMVIYADVGGFPGPYSQVKIDLFAKEVELHTKFLFSDGIPVHNHKELIKEDIELFLTELYKCDFVNWAEEYGVTAPIMDGSHWSVRIEYDTHCEIKYGSNHFPPKWAKFCKAISKLTGNEFY